MSALGLPSAKDLGTRFSVTDSLPAVTATLIVMVVIWSGAPGQPPSVDRVRHSANALSAEEWVALGLVLFVFALVVHPLQLRVVRVLEGYSGAKVLHPLIRRLRDRQIDRWRALNRVAVDPHGAPFERAAAAETLRYGFPPHENRILATRLGNVLRAAEDRAGEYYGWSTIAAWPRLYILVPDPAKALVVDARNQLDTACRFVVSFAVAALIVLVILAPQGPWLLAGLPLAVMSWVSYRAAVDAAGSYGAVIQSVFDLYRFELLRAMHFRLPQDADEERLISGAISQWLLQGRPHELPYDHSGAEVDGN